MNKNTLKTTWGFIVTMIRKYAGMPAGGKQLDDIYNYVRIDDRIGTSGQPTEKQFELIKAEGFTSVINLAPADTENSLKDEAGTLASLGLRYEHIPVNFAKPSQRKFKMFTEAMAGMENEKVWVHCAANMRVSAFMFRYRTEVLGVNKATAQTDLDRIWEPFETWQPFMAGEPDQ